MGGRLAREGGGGGGGQKKLFLNRRMFSFDIQLILDCKKKLNRNLEYIKIQLLSWISIDKF